MITSTALFLISAVSVMISPVASVAVVWKLPA
jgi:hypothetical protein